MCPTKPDLVKKPLTIKPGRWEYSHMETTLVKADDKGRVCIRGTRKGAKYLVTAENGGWWIMPAPKIIVPEKMNRPPGPGNCAPPRWKAFMINPKPGEVVLVDLGLKGKLRPLLVVSREDADAERALCVCCAVDPRRFAVVIMK